MRPTQWRRSTHVVIGVAVVLLVAAVVLAAALLQGGQSSDAVALPAAPAPATADPGIKPVSDSADKPTPDKLAATLALTLADPNLGAFTGRITDAATGEQLWTQGADVPMQPASVTKVLTTAAALHALDRDARLTTTVLASDRPDDALRLLASHPGPVDVLVTDVVMPGMSGPALAERARESRPDLRVVFMSGYTVEEVVRQGVHEDEVDFLQKPFTPDNLVRRLLGVFGHDETHAARA